MSYTLPNLTTKESLVNYILVIPAKAHYNLE